MKYLIGQINLSEVFIFIAIGILIFIGFSIVNNFIIPLLKDAKHPLRKYWVKAKIIFWLAYANFFFLILFYASPLLTLTLSAITLSLAWGFWRNIIAGVIIKFNNQFELGEIISSDFATGQLKAIYWTQSELINDKGELLVVPNHKLRNVVLKHFYKKDNLQSYSFKVFSSSQSTANIYQLALCCPFISTNQEIEVKKIKEAEFSIKVALIDVFFIEEVNLFFENLSKD